DTSATISGDGDSEVISQADVLSAIQDPVSVANEASQSARKARCRNGDQAVIPSSFSFLHEPQLEAPGREDLGTVEHRAAGAIVALIAPEDRVLAAVAAGGRL